MDFYMIGKYKFFDLLVIINSNYFENLIIGENLRELNEKEIVLYNQLLENFLLFFYTENDFETIVELTLNLVGFFLYRQPFYDGNTRTLRKFLQLLFYTLNYEIDLSYTENDYPIIPIFYSDDEKCTKNNIEELKRRLVKFN